MNRAQITKLYGGSTVSEAKELRNVCIEAIKKELSGRGMALTEINGNYFSGVDIALKENDEICIYRIVVTKHNPPKE